MQALVIEQPGTVSVQTVPDPTPQEGEVIIKVAASGLCGTDIHLYHGEFEGVYPLIPGHEGSGTIAEIGPGVKKDWAVGQRVTFDPNIACENCAYCERGLYNHCANWTALGVSKPGAFAEYMAVPEDVLFDIGDLSFTAGAFVEPLACVAHGLNMAHIAPGDAVLIFGAGPMGLQLLQAAQASGARRVVVSEPDPDRQALAAELGATVAPFGSLQENYLRDLEPIGYDLVIDATGLAPVVESALSYVRPAGTMLIFGVCSKEARIPLSPFEVYRRDLTIVGSFALNRTFPPALEWLQSGAVQVEPLLSHTVALEDMPAVLKGERDLEGQIKIQMQIT